MIVCTRKTFQKVCARIWRSITIVRKPNKHELKVVERATAVKSHDVAKVSRIHVRQNECLMWKAYHGSVSKACTIASQATKISEDGHPRRGFS